MHMAISYLSNLSKLFSQQYKPGLSSRLFVFSIRSLHACPVDSQANISTLHGKLNSSQIISNPDEESFPIFFLSWFTVNHFNALCVGAVRHANLPLILGGTLAGVAPKKTSLYIFQIAKYTAYHAYRRSCFSITWNMYAVSLEAIAWTIFRNRANGHAGWTCRFLRQIHLHADIGRRLLLAQKLGPVTRPVNSPR